MKRNILSALAVLVLAGCATGAPGSARNLCYKAGYQPGTEAFENCWKGERDRQFAADGGAMLIGAAAGVIASQPSGAVYTDPARPATAPAGSIMCPNGAFVYGRRCVMNPDGTFSGAP